MKQTRRITGNTLWRFNHVLEQAGQPPYLDKLDCTAVDLFDFYPTEGQLVLDALSLATDSRVSLGDLFPPYHHYRDLEEYAHERLRYKTDFPRPVSAEVRAIKSTLLSFDLHLGMAALGTRAGMVVFDAFNPFLSDREVAAILADFDKPIHVKNGTSVEVPLGDTVETIALTAYGRPLRFPPFLAGYGPRSERWYVRHVNRGRQVRTL